MDNLKGELANKDQSAAKEQKVIPLQVKFKPNVNRVIEEIADCGNIDIASTEKV